MGVVEKILEVVGINVNVLDGYGDSTSLYEASSNGHVDTVKVLLAAKDINVNQADKDGTTPLWVASQNSHTDVIKQLLTTNGIDLNKDYEGTSPLQTAIQKKHIEIT